MQTGTRMAAGTSPPDSIRGPRADGTGAATQGAFHPLTITETRRETEDAISLAFAIPEPLRARFAFTPGQYLTLRTTLDGEDTRRSYSICSAPGDEPLRVAIKRVDDGRFSTWAHRALQPGHVIDVMPPAGRFTAPPGAGAILAIAAGSGITPILSIVKTTLTRDPAARVALLYGSRSTATILFRDELEALKDRFMARLSIVHVLSREQQDIPILNGRLDAAKITSLLPGLFPGALPDAALLCGPGALIQSATDALIAAGMAPAQILSERFTAEGQPAPRPRPAPLAIATPFAIATIVSDGIRTQVPMAEGEAVLDAALRAGLDLPWSCRGGMCSTCRARVTEGAVTMDVNYGLEPWETEAGYVLTCQSHPTTPHVTIDYDHV